MRECCVFICNSIKRAVPTYTLSGTVFVDGSPYSSGVDNSLVSLALVHPLTGAAIDLHLFAYVDQASGQYAFPAVPQSLFQYQVRGERR